MTLALAPRNDVPGPPPAPDPLHPGKPPPNTRAHWPNGVPQFGDPIARVQSVMIHETSGWPSYASSGSFQSLFKSLNSLDWVGPNVTGHWVDKRGIGPQYFVEPNGTAFTLIGPQNLVGDARITWHGETMNRLSVGIENSNIGDSGVTPGAGNGPRWFRLTANAQDLPGRKAFLVLHPDNAEDALLIWIAQFPGYTGPGDIPTPANWDNMLFTERDYRTLVLLCRLLAEQFGIPRNFLIFPYLARADRADPALFRRMILADQLGDAIARKLGTTIAVIQADGAPYTTWYNPNQAANWSRFFGANPANLQVQDTPCYKGFLSHAINGGHPCPGPLFDWHRFAREVWDWWWYPFDINPVRYTCNNAFGAPVLSNLAPTTADLTSGMALSGVGVPDGARIMSVDSATQITMTLNSTAPITVFTAGRASGTPRSYRDARRDTALIEYYWEATGSAAQYDGLRLPQSASETFRLADNARIYAMANGVVVAARIPVAEPATNGLLLVRHEVFHQGVNGRIDYDQDPTFVWTLTYYLRNAGFAIPPAPPAAAGALPAINPDWLNRFIIRLVECELAVAFHTAHAGNAALARGWSHAPSGAGPRLPTGQEIERDAASYRAIAGDLSAGRAALFPLESQISPAPVRVCLGDFLGFPGRIPVVGVDAVRFEIFSLDQLPVPNALRRQVSAAEDNEDWWNSVTAAARHEDPAGADLPANGMVWQYTLRDFLTWVNNVTWASEWQKYDVTAPGGGPAPVPARPVGRR